jgi:hypothetical protein
MGHAYDGSWARLCPPTFPEVEGTGAERAPLTACAPLPRLGTRAAALQELGGEQRWEVVLALLLVDTVALLPFRALWPDLCGALRSDPEFYVLHEVCRVLTEALEGAAGGGGGDAPSAGAGRRGSDPAAPATGPSEGAETD